MRFTRRKFLKTATGTAIVAGAGGWAAGWTQREDGDPRIPTSVPPLFPAPHVIRYDSQCFTIRDRDTFLHSASFHYPRCPEPLWRDRLRKLRRAGFNTIQSYVFWNYHEPVEGQANLEEFERFVETVGEMGFWMVARPGPYVCAEWDAGGFPHWVIAKKFPLRSNAPESLRTSRHWYDLVMPAIERHQITRGGPIVLVQIENEYDYWKLDEADKTAYITALAEMAWNKGIAVPLITCWTHQVRERPNAALAHVMDCCNFYPGWKIVEEVVPGLAQLRKEQPRAPEAITELQGGWFSEFGGPLSKDQPGIGPPQLNMITKTAIEQGVTFYNYYMGFGGTNFDWAGKGLTTTYDYDAPLHEPGGMGEKFYVARGVCQSLGLLGDALTRAEMAETQPETTNAAVSASLRILRQGERASGALFLRENANADQTFRLRMADPAHPERQMLVPRRGTLMLGAREMKLCPVGLAIEGGELRYATAEVLARGEAGRAWLILYDEPDRLMEISLGLERFPRIEGETIYREWEPVERSAVIGLRTNEDPRMVLLDERLQIILLQRESALRSWMADFPREVVTGDAAGGATVSIPFLGDAALLGASGNIDNGIWAELDFRPGDHALTVLLPRKPSTCRVNGAETEVSYDAMWQTAQIGLTTPDAPARAMDISAVETWVERFDPMLGSWQLSELKPLEDMGEIPYGYVKYRYDFHSGGVGQLRIKAFADDGKRVFLNGRLLKGPSQAATDSSGDMAGIATQGMNRLDICYELFGSPNFGPKIGELKGIESAAISGTDGETKLDGRWQIQRFPAPMRGRGIDPDFHSGAWAQAALGKQGASAGIAPAFTWCRGEFSLPQPAENWQIAWRAEFRADRDALLYLNGKFLGRYVTIGPQTEFFLPDSYLHFGGQPNVLTVVLAYAEDASAIRELRIAPYDEFAIHRTRVEFEW